MILTTKGRYAVMAVIDLYEESNDFETMKPVSLLTISQRQNISLSYLEQIFANLRRQDIVKSVKGPGGGYVLKRKPQEISVFDVILATGEKIKMTACKSSGGGCEMARKSKKKVCRTHDLWRGLEDNIHGHLRSISIFDICNKNN